MPVESQEALDGVVLDRYHRKMRESLRPLVTAEIIKEHRQDPFGQPSDGLRRILTYLGNLPVDGKLITEHDGAERWYVCRLVGSPPVRAERVAGPVDQQTQAMEIVFRQRLAEVFGLEPGLTDVAI